MKKNTLATIGLIVLWLAIFQLKSVWYQAAAGLVIVALVASICRYKYNRMPTEAKELTRMEREARSNAKIFIAAGLLVLVFGVVLPTTITAYRNNLGTICIGSLAIAVGLYKVFGRKGPEYSKAESVFFFVPVFGPLYVLIRLLTWTQKTKKQSPKNDI